jgi:hypothetical protein
MTQYDETGLPMLATADKGAPVMQKCNSDEWMKEVKRRVNRVDACLATNRSGYARMEILELIAAAQILYGEIVNEQKQS